MLCNNQSDSLNQVKFAGIELICLCNVLCPITGGIETEAENIITALQNNSENVLRKDLKK